MKWFIVLLALIYIVLEGSASAGEVTISINAKELANEKISIAFPYIRDKINIDASGKGQMNFPFINRTFAILSFYKGKTSIYRIIYFDKPSQLTIGIKAGKISFSGEGSGINNLILNCDNYIEPREKKIQIIYDQDKPLADVVSAFLKLDAEFEKYYSIQKKKIHLEPEDNYLIYNHFISTLLGRKQQVISLLPIEEADSLNLINKLGISPNQLFSDSLLVKAGSVSFKNFLTWHNTFRLVRSVPYSVVGPEKYPRATNDYIFNDSIYSKANKEHILSANLVYCISNLGVTKDIDLLIEEFNANFPGSNYSNHLNDLRIKYDVLSPGKMAPNWSLKSSDGKTYSLSDLKGKVVFLDVWATWCLPCIKEMPNILEYQKQYSNITFLFISIDKDLSQWKRFLNEHPENTAINLNSGNSDFEKLYRVSGVPRQILIDNEGKIIDAFINHGDLMNLLKLHSN